MKPESRKNLILTSVLAICLAGCGRSPNEPAAVAPSMVPIRISTGSDSGLNVVAGQDTLRSPFSLSLPPHGSMYVSMIRVQEYDLDSLVDGDDTRFIFQGWSDTAESQEKRLISADGASNPDGRYAKEFKVQVSSDPDFGEGFNDTSWVPAGTRRLLIAPLSGEYAFRHWLVNGILVSTLPSLNLVYTGPTDVRAVYRKRWFLNIQSDWSSGLSVMVGDSLGSTPVRKEIRLGDSLSLLIPQNQEDDVSPFVDGKDVRLRGTFADRGQPREVAKTVRFDSSVDLFISTRRSYKVATRVIPPIGGSYTLVSSIPPRNPPPGMTEDTAARPGNGWFLENHALALTARANPNWVFSHWDLNGQHVGSQETLSVAVNWPSEIHAVFISQFSLNLTSWPDTSLILQVGDSVFEAPRIVEYSNRRQILVAAPSPQFRAFHGSPGGPSMRYLFKRWREDGSTQNPRSINLTEPDTLTAEFATEYLVTSITPSSSGGEDSIKAWLPADSSARFVARPVPGFRVNYWYVDDQTVEAGDTLSIPVNGPLTVKPHYASVNLEKQMAEIMEKWSPALGSEGGETAMRLVSRFSGECAEYGSSAELRHAGDSLRAEMLAATGIDLHRKVLSHAIQRRFQGPGYSIEVARLEIYQGIYLPVNIYIPDDKEPNSCPLVITPPGFAQGASLDLVQQRAANFALQGMMVIVPEGFNSNGARAAMQGDNNFLLYARELLGLPSSNSVFLQEMVSTITWAGETFPQVDPERIAVSGYSYGGGMAFELAQVDTRVRSLSVPATNFGNPCGSAPLAHDINVETEWGPGFVWSPPPELPILAPNSDVAMVYPRYLQTTSGLNDEGAPPSIMGPVMSLAQKWYGTAGLRQRVRFQTDDGDHNYGVSRRENSYSWFAYSLFSDSLSHPREAPIPLFSPEELEPDIAGSNTLVGELEEKVAAQIAYRFSRFDVAGDFSGRVKRGMDELFGDAGPAKAVLSQAWNANDTDGMSIQAFRVRTPHMDVPLFVFENPALPEGSEVLYLPSKGTRQDASVVTDLLSRYRRVYSIDYLGVGESRSNSLMMHTMARFFMFNNPSVPQLIVESLRSYVRSRSRPLDVYGNGWASSFFAASLKYLEPERIGLLQIEGVPALELDYLSSGNKVPDLLLWGSLFSKVTVAEIEAATLAR